MEKEPIRNETHTISKEYLEEAYEKMQESFKPIKEKFQKDKEDIEASFKALLSVYYDEQLIDSQNKPVRIGDTITDGKDYYQVFDRGMQIIFGTMLYNNSVKCKKLDRDFRPGKKEHSFSSRELIAFTLHIL